MDNIIEITNLVKNYGDVKAVDDITFGVERGSLFAFLGINGAGKSTTINVLCSLLQKESGKVYIDGHDLDKEADEIKKKIGIVFQTSVLDEKLSVKDNLKIRASYYGIRGDAWKTRLVELIEMFELDEIIKRPYGKLSGGQKRRVDIARGLINKPILLFLDEPTTGLDPRTRKVIWKIIDKLREDDGMTIFLTTHYMEEANEANHVVIIDKGKVIASDSPVNLKNIYSGDYLKWYRAEDGAMSELFNANGRDWRYENGAYVIKMASAIDAKDFIVKYQEVIDDFELIKGNMDDVFLQATGTKLEV